MTIFAKDWLCSRSNWNKRIAVNITELTCCVALFLQKIAKGRRPVPNAVWRARKANCEKISPERMLSEDERGTSRRAALLGVGGR